MKINLDKALEACGDKNKYQVFQLLVACLAWLCTDFIAINFPVLIFYPEMKCREKRTGQYVVCDEKDCCDDKFTEGGIVPNVIYNNIITDRKMYCEKTVIGLIIIVYTIGIVVGAAFSSKYTDIYGRKIVTIVSLVLFIIAILIMGLLRFSWALMISVFIMGIGSSGATMTTFMSSLEICSSKLRGLFAILINSSYALAGLLYYFAFEMVKNWHIQLVMSLCGGTLALLLYFFYFLESPRYYYSAKMYKHCLKCLLTISNRNGRRNYFAQYLKEEVLSSNQLNTLGTEFINKTVFNSNELKHLLDNLNYDESYTQTPVQKPKKESIDIESEFNTSLNNNEETVRDKVRKNRGSIIGDENAPSVQSEEENLNEAIEISENKKDPGISALCKYKSISKSFAICCFNWCLVTYVYFGCNYDQKKEGDKIFNNGYIMFSAEYVAYLCCGIIMSISFIGRVGTIGHGGLLMAIFGVLYSIFKDKYETFGYIILFPFRFFTTCIFTAMYTYSTEIYPTSIRSKGLGINLLCARFTTIVIALTIDKYSPYIAFSIMGVILFGMQFLMKETNGKELQDEIEEIIEESKIKSNQKNMDILKSKNSSSDNSKSDISQNLLDK